MPSIVLTRIAPLSPASRCTNVMYGTSNSFIGDVTSTSRYCRSEKPHSDSSGSANRWWCNDASDTYFQRGTLPCGLLRACLRLLVSFWLKIRSDKGSGTKIDGGFIPFSSSSLSTWRLNRFRPGGGRHTFHNWFVARMASFSVTSTLARFVYNHK